MTCCGSILRLGFCLVLFSRFMAPNNRRLSAPCDSLFNVYASVDWPLFIGLFGWETVVNVEKFIFNDRCPRRRRRNQWTPELATTAMNQQRDNKRKKQPTHPAANHLSVSVIPVEAAEEDPTADDPQTVSVTSCLVVMSSFVIGGAILFSVWEVTKMSFPLIDFFKKRDTFFFQLIFTGMGLCGWILFLFHKFIDHRFWRFRSRSDDCPFTRRRRQ